MKTCPTSNMNRSKLWGFEVNQIIFSFAVLTVSNVGIGILGLPLFLSWIAGVATLVILRLLSLGQKDGHLELSIQFLILPHLYLGHGDRRRDA
jgi:hypothetical protein